MSSKEIRVKGVQIVGESTAEEFGYYSIDELDFEILRVSVPGDPNANIEVLGFVMPQGKLKTYWLRRGHTSISFPKDLTLSINVDTSEITVSLNGHMYYERENLDHIGEVSSCDLKAIDGFYDGTMEARLRILTDMMKNKKNYGKLQEKQVSMLADIESKLNGLFKRLKHECANNN
ncbi:TPA: hypothetical protein SFZ43_000074 [Campylobacter jejuni]|nr:hypothetical protein [Campylobacter jejuni]